MGHLGRRGHAAAADPSASRDAGSGRSHPSPEPSGHIPNQAEAMTTLKRLTGASAVRLRLPVRHAGYVQRLVRTVLPAVRSMARDELLHRRGNHNLRGRGLQTQTGSSSIGHSRGPIPGRTGSFLRPRWPWPSGSSPSGSRLLMLAPKSVRQRVGQRGLVTGVGAQPAGAGDNRSIPLEDTQGIGRTTTADPATRVPGG